MDEATHSEPGEVEGAEADMSLPRYSLDLRVGVRAATFADASAIEDDINRLLIARGDVSDCKSTLT